MAFPFLDLPVELQVNVVNNTSAYSELKALRLVSKQLYDITTPRFYYKVNLYTTSGRYGPYHVPDESKDQRMLSKIHSLLVKPANLGFVKVLNTGWFGYRSTNLMNKILPLLRRDSLIRFHYYTGSRFCFPTPRQLDSIYRRQKRIQELKLDSHMIPWLKELEREHSQIFRVQSLTEFDYSNSMDSRGMTPDKVYWPFRNLNLSLIKRLSLNDQDPMSRREFRVIIDLFFGKSFVNLTRLSLRNITFGKTISFTNMPSLRSLVVEHCSTTNMRNRLRLPLEFPENFPLESLKFWTAGRSEPLSHLLTQFRKLKKLIIKTKPSAFLPDYQAGTDFISAVMLHKDTLRLFEIIGRDQGFPILSQLFPRLHLEKLPNFYYGAWSLLPESHTMIRLSAD